MDELDYSTVIDRLRDYKGFSKDSELADFLGVSRQNLSAWRARNTLNINKIVDKMPEISRVWLLTGEGSMIVGNNQESAGVNVTGTGNHVSHNHVGGTDRTLPSGYYDALKESQRQTTQLIQSLQTAQELQTNTQALQTNTQAQLDKLLARLADSQAQIARLIQLLSDKTDK